MPVGVSRRPAVHQIVQAIRLIDDHLRIIMQLVVSDFAGQLRCAANATQRILDLMGQSPHQFLSGGPSAAQNFLLIYTLCMLQRVQLDQGRDFAAGMVGVDGVVHQNRALVLEMESAIRRVTLMPFSRAMRIS